MNLFETSSAIGLHAYHQDHPGASFFERFYSFVRERIACLGVEPTYFGVSGEGYLSKYVKFGGRTHRRVVDANFQNVTGLSVAANPPGSREPAYDSYFESSVGLHSSGFPQSRGKVIDLWFVMNESLLPFGSNEYERTIQDLIELHPWDFGMGFSDLVERHPEFHVGELGHDKLTVNEREANNIWYNVPPELRIKKLRSVYPYNIVNEGQLAQEVQSGLTLRQFIQDRSIGMLQPLPGGRLHLWRVPDTAERRSLRTHLKQRGIVIDDATLIP